MFAGKRRALRRGGDLTTPAFRGPRVIDVARFFCLLDFAEP
jgi:hypothetical protein